MSDDVTIKKTSDILTKEELKKEEKVKVSSPSNKPDKKQPKKEVIKPKKEVNLLKEKQDVEVKFECGFAPGGESTIAFLHKWEGKEYKYNLSLNNKIYILPSNLTGEEKRRYRAALRANGFMDITVIESGASFDDKENEYVFDSEYFIGIISFVASGRWPDEQAE